MKLIFLVSGNGGNLKFFSHAIQEGFASNIELSVIADRNCGALDFAKMRQMPNKLIRYSRENNAELRDALAILSPDLVVTNWHKMLDGEIVSLYRHRLINLHYSLLPAFQGAIGTRPVQLALEKDCRFVGVTSHFVDEGLDTGKILGQAIINVNDRKLDALMEEIFRKGCMLLLNTVQKVSAQRFIAYELGYDLTFSPPLEFDKEKFTVDFWKKVAES